MSKTSHCEACTRFLFLVTLAKSGNPKMTSKQISYFLFLCEWNFAGQNMQKKTYLPYWGVDENMSELSQVTNQFSLSLHTSLVILFFVCSLSICWRWFSESLTLLETGPSTLVDQSFKTKVKRSAHKNEESHLAAGEQKIIVIALSSNQLNCT